MDNRPPFIYKYKSIATKLDLVRLLDTIQNNRIYMPRYRQLNDPLEGEVISVEIEGYAVNIPASVSLLSGHRKP